jgi:hypothetical protein
MALAGGSVSPHVVDELFARAEGNPFFTEQLVAAALAGGGGGGLRVPAGLPARLAELLTARAGRCAGDARAVLAGLAVAGRPLTEAQVGQVTGLDTDAVREGLRELTAARLLAEAPVAEDAVSGGHRARHALLAEAVAGELLAGERALLHERTARVLAGDSGLAAEVAGHWQAAGRPAEELPARVAAAKAAERVFGHAQAAAHWQRAIELSQAQPDIAAVASGPNLPRLYVRAIDALSRLSQASPASRSSQPSPPPRVSPAMPVVPSTPPVVASPYAWVAASSSLHSSPAPAVAVWAVGSIMISFSVDRSIMRAPSATAKPGAECPPPRTLTGRPCSRAKRTAAATSPAPLARAISAGRRSTAPFHTWRAAS